MADEVDAKNIEYILVFTLQKKDEFEDEVEYIYTKDRSKEKFSNRETLKNEMKKEVDMFGKFDRTRWKKLIGCYRRYE